MTTRFIRFSLPHLPFPFTFFIAFMSYIVNANSELSWGANGAGGDGTWDSITPNWFDGTNTIPWVDEGSAVFSGVAGTISISGSVRAGEVSFGVPGYVLNGGTLLGGPEGLFIRTDADATVNSSIVSLVSSTGIFKKTGDASLTVASGLSSFSSVTVEAGELKTSDSFVNAPVSLSPSGDATLTLGSPGSTFIGGLSGGGFVQPDVNVAAKTLVILGSGGSFGGSIRDNTGATLGLSKSGANLQQLTGTNSYSGNTIISAGTLSLAESGTALNTALGIYGGTLLLDNSTISLPDRISDTAPVGISAGTIVLQGNNSVSATESAGALMIGNNPVSIAVHPDPRNPPHSPLPASEPERDITPELSLFPARHSAKCRVLASRAFFSKLRHRWWVSAIFIRRRSSCPAHWASARRG
jgi:autotransporter-associated beta strand protein